MIKSRCATRWLCRALVVPSLWLSPAVVLGQVVHPGLANRVVGGQAEAGEGLVRRLGCRACHAIPGQAGPFGRVGPDLGGVGKRAYIGGSFPNNPGNLVRWLRNPPALAPGTVMPSFGLDEQQAKDIAAYLHTLDGPRSLF